MHRQALHDGDNLRLSASQPGRSIQLCCMLRVYLLERKLALTMYSTASAMEYPRLRSRCMYAQRP